jgi:hypothetical protein
MNARATLSDCSTVKENGGGTLCIHFLAASLVKPSMEDLLEQINGKLKPIYPWKLKKKPLFL